MHTLVMTTVPGTCRDPLMTEVTLPPSRLLLKILPEPTSVQYRKSRLINVAN